MTAEHKNEEDFCACWNNKNIEEVKEPKLQEKLKILQVQIRTCQKW